MQLTEVTKRYGGVTALDNLTLTVANGETTAVLGESGAGKTTLLRIIAGLTSCEGEVSGAGRVSYVFQESKLLPNLTAEENLRFVLPKSEWEKTGETLDRVGLGGKQTRYPAQLSGGERQRVSLARALLFPHDVLLMDEPFSSLDLGLKKSLVELVRELQQERKETVVFVTHDVHEAVLLSSRAVVLSRGSIILDIAIAAPPADFFARGAEEEILVRALTGAQVL